MLKITEPLLTICFRSSAVPQIKNELKTFGLNPHDWEVIDRRPFDRQTHLILVHREDDDMRIAVKLHPDADRSPSPTIKTVEWLITGA